MTGTFGGALEARQIPAGEGFLSSETTGEIETESNVLVVRRIHVDYRLRLKPEQRETAERAHGMHHNACPVYRTISGCVDITTSLSMEDDEGLRTED
ncbi:MAG: OsmC family protein [Chloroflexia bacterium]|nr:OsmC family protein [Chloroflexia bacterium]